MIQGNEPFLVAHIGARTIKARVFAGMTEESDEWIQRAHALKYRLDNAEDAQSYAAIIPDVVAFVADYPLLQIGSNRTIEVPASVWDEASRAQIVSALEVLLEANDPFVRTKRQREENSILQVKALLLMEPEKINAALEKSELMQFAQSQSATE